MTSNQEGKELKVKVCVLGVGNVGKTSLTYRFLNKDLLEIPDETIEDNYKTYEKINDQKVQINILDTAGQDDYQNLIDSWIEASEGFILVFALNSQESFNDLKRRYDRILEIHGHKCPIIFVGNKKDLENQRFITYEKAKALCDEMNVPYCETSAKLNDNCKAPLIDIVKKILSRKCKDDQECGCYIV